MLFPCDFKWQMKRFRWITFVRFRLNDLFVWYNGHWVRLGVYRAVNSCHDSAERHDSHSLVPVESELGVFHNLHDVTGTEVQGTDIQEQECKQTMAVYDWLSCVQNNLKRRERTNDVDLSSVISFFYFIITDSVYRGLYLPSVSQFHLTATISFLFCFAMLSVVRGGALCDPVG